jgi:hypothetical protein
VWSVYDDQCGGDHYPIVLSAINSMPVARPQKLKLAEADWSSFVQRCELELDNASLDTAADPVQTFSAIPMRIAKETIPVTSATAGAVRKPWFNKDCKTAIRDRKRALRQFNLSPTAANLSNIRISRAKAEEL